MKRKTLLSFAALTVIIFGAFGIMDPNSKGGHSCKGDPKEMAAHRTEKMDQFLDLTDDQEEKVHAIHLKYAEKMKGSHQEMKGKKGHHICKSGMKGVMKDAHEEIMEVLDEEQQEKFQEHIAERKAHHQKMKKAHKEMMSELKEKRAEFDENLSEEEKETLAEVREELPGSFGQGCAKGGHGKHGKKGHCGTSCDDKGKKECSHGKMGHGKHGKGMKHGMHGKKAHHSGMKKKLEPVHEIAQNHESELKPIFKEMHEKMQEKVGDSPHAKCHGEKERDAHQGHRFKRMSTRFLLMSPGEMEEGPEVKLSPNPARSQLRIEYELKRKADVRIEVRNQSGNLLESFDQGKREAGTHELSIGLTSFQTKNHYLIKVITDHGVTTEKLMKVQ